MPLLTPKQAQVLEAIRRHIAVTGQSPTVREIGQSVSLKSSCSVQKHLDSLERLGKIRRSSFKYRSIEIVDNTSTDTAACVLVPLLDNTTGAPKQMQTATDPELLSLPECLLPRVERRSQADACASRNYASAPLFALTVKGDSMADAGIGNGDIVVARRQRAAEYGDIIVATVGADEATVKRFVQNTASSIASPTLPCAGNAMQVVGKVAMAIKLF